jgi:hypothetical protein
MPIREIIRNEHAFSPEESRALVEAFESCLRRLGLVDREDPLTLLVAKRIVELAKEGERDPAKLCERAETSIKT